MNISELEDIYIENETNSVVQDMYNMYDDYTIYEASLGLPFVSQVVLITLYSLTIILSITGNLIVIIVLSLGNRSRKDLSKYLINLAISDILMATFCMPFTYFKVMIGRWTFGLVMCKLVAFMQVMSVSASVYTNVAIGLDRLIAVLCPLKQRIGIHGCSKFCGPTRTIPIIWIGSVLVGSVELFIRTTRTFATQNFTYEDCTDVWFNIEAQRSYLIVLLFITYLLPLVILFVTYHKLSTLLWNYRPPGVCQNRREERRTESRKRVTKMLVAIVVMFALCWLPLHVFNLLIEFSSPFLSLAIQYTTLFYAVFYTCHWLAMSNSFTNPIIYCFLSDNFKADLKYILRHSVICRPINSKKSISCSFLRKSHSSRKLVQQTTPNTHAARELAQEKVPSVSLLHQPVGAGDIAQIEVTI